jgi:hypothetical protein
MKVQKKCKYCKKEFYVIKSRINTAKYCSYICYHNSPISERTRKNLSGHRMSKEVKRKMVNTRLLTDGYKQSEETKRKISKGHIGKEVSKETREKLSKIFKGKTYEEKYGIKKANLLKKNKSILMKEKWKSPEYAKRVIKSWRNSLQSRPTSFEQKISDLCLEYNLPFLYKGDGSFLINFKNPDFVNEKDKVVIEVFYSWFKIRAYGSVENYKEFCRRKYHPKGWKVIFIDETEINIKNWKEVCLNKIK